MKISDWRNWLNLRRKISNELYMEGGFHNSEGPGVKNELIVIMIIIIMILREKTSLKREGL